MTTVRCRSTAEHGTPDSAAGLTADGIVVAIDRRCGAVFLADNVYVLSVAGSGGAGGTGTAGEGADG
jgi:hypothetical protein